jgi:ElaB/YqjD/DUF883 family membrane-anchored ribosome-binding protein
MAELQGSEGGHPTLQTSTSSTSEMVEATGNRVTNQARSVVRNLANSQKGRVAERLGGVAQVLHETAKNIEQQDATAGRYASQVADQFDRFTQNVKERPIEDLFGDAEEFARHQPLLFIGGAVAAGFLLGRMIKSADTRTAHRTAEELATEAQRVAGETAEAVGEAGQSVGRRVAEAAGMTPEAPASGASGTVGGSSSQPIGETP